MNRSIFLPGLSCCVLLAGCSGSGVETQTTEGNLIAACNWPAAASTFDADAGEGCTPRSMFDICQVPDGSTILADGGVLTPDGGVVVCDDACTPSEYSLTCENATPDSSLGCAAIPIPTPSALLFFCCPCSQ
jgi:hypothetical protein